MDTAQRIPSLLKIEDVATMAQLHERTVRRWIKRGWLRAIKRGRVVRILSEDVLDFIEHNRL